MFLNTARETLSPERAANGEMEMNAQAAKLQAAENDLKQLMADVSLAMEKAEEAAARIAPRQRPHPISQPLCSHTQG